MRSIDEVIDLARERGHFTSDQHLGRAMQLSRAAINHWRTKRCWPSEIQMVELARLAELDPAEGLMILNYWRSKSPVAREQYLRLAGELAAKVSAVLIACFLLFPPHEAKARTDQPGISKYYTLCANYVWR